MQTCRKSMRAINVFPCVCCHQSAEDIRNSATVAHAAALGGLVARAEAEAAQRSAARRAAADWLRGDFTAEANVMGCSRQYTAFRYEQSSILLVEQSTSRHDQCALDCSASLGCAFGSAQLVHYM